jgi:hypothetical protein
VEDTTVESRQLPWPLLLLLQILWALISLLMLLMAVIGVICLALGALSLVVDLSRFLEMQLGGEPVRTTAQKALFAGVGAVMALTGIGFWWLRQRGSVAGALICWVLLLVLFLAVAWTTGRGEVISVGMPAQ